MELFQGTLTLGEYGIGITLAILGGGIKAALEGCRFRVVVLNAVMGIFVAAVSGLVLIEYLTSKSMIVATMGLSGYMGASFLDALNILGKTIETIKKKGL